MDYRHWQSCRMSNFVESNKAANDDSGNVVWKKAVKA